VAGKSFGERLLLGLGQQEQQKRSRHRGDAAELDRSAEPRARGQNSDGLQPALDAAKTKKVPVVTIDRKVTSQPCTDYLTFIGSNFVEQGRRAAQAMAKATGGSGKVVILLGS